MPTIKKHETGPTWNYKGGKMADQFYRLQRWEVPLIRPYQQIKATTSVWRAMTIIAFQSAGSNNSNIFPLFVSFFFESSDTTGSRWFEIWYYWCTNETFRRVASRLAPMKRKFTKLTMYCCGAQARCFMIALYQYFQELSFYILLNSLTSNYNHHVFHFKL